MQIWVMQAGILREFKYWRLHIQVCLGASSWDCSLSKIVQAHSMLWPSSEAWVDHPEELTGPWRPCDCWSIITNLQQRLTNTGILNHLETNVTMSCLDVNAWYLTKMLYECLTLWKHDKTPSSLWFTCYLAQHGHQCSRGQYNQNKISQNIGKWRENISSISQWTFCWEIIKACSDDTQSQPATFWFAILLKYRYCINNC